MNIEFSSYENNGRILFTGSVPEEDLAIQLGNVIIGKADTEVDYVIDGAISLRPDSTAVLTGLTLTGLIPGCTITINGVSYPCTDDTAVLSFNHVGLYDIIVDNFPQKEKAFEVLI